MAVSFAAPGAAPSFPPPGARCKVLPGSRTSAGDAGADWVGTVEGRLGHSVLVGVRLPDPTRVVVVEARNVRVLPRHIPLATLLTESEMRALWGDR